MDFGQALLTAVLSGLFSFGGVIMAARLSAGAVQKAAERGAKAALDSATTTAAATVHAAELARTTSKENDLRARRREEVGPLLDKAAAREQGYRAISAYLQLGWNFDMIDDQAKQMNQNFSLSARDKYIGMDEPNFYTTVTAYLAAERDAAAALFHVQAMREVEPILRAGGVPCAPLAITTTREKYAKEMESAVAALGPAVIALNQAAGPYMLGESI